MIVVFQILTWALWVASAGLIIWALFSDRSKGRMRCPRCWYSMDGMGRACPECGRVVRKAADLRRTRRRWRWVFAGVVAFGAGWFTHVWPQASASGWMSLLPNRVVIELLPLGGASGPFGQSLQQRIGRAPNPSGALEVTMSPRDHLLLARRAAHGNLLARPIGDAWRQSYGALIRQGVLFDLYSLEGGRGVYLDGTQADDRLRDGVRELLSLPVELHVRTRDRWPVGVPVLIEMKYDHWWPRGVGDSVMIDWSANGGAAGGQGQGARWHCTFDIPLEGRVEVDLDIGIIQEHRWPPSRERIEVGRELATVAYETVESIDDILSAVSGKEIDALLKDQMVVTWDQGLPDFDLRGLAGTPLDGVTIGAHVDYYQDGVLRSWNKIRCKGGTNLTAMLGMHRVDGANWPEGGAWTMKIRTDDGWVLGDLDADTYWKGEIELPVD